MGVPIELRRVLKRHPVLWLGAGASRQAEPPLPTLAGLVKDLQSEFEWDAPADMDDPYAIIDAWLKQRIGSRGDLADFLERRFRPGGKAPRPGQLHRYLAALAGAGIFPAVIDTNYDLLLKTRLAEDGVPFTSAVLDHNLELPDQGLRYLSLHGSWDDWSTIVLSGDSQRQLDERYPFLRSQLDILLLRHPVLFVGCSLQDPRLLRWLIDLKPEDRGKLKTWVALLSPGAIKELEKARWEDERSYRELLDLASIQLLEMPDFPALPAWLQELASQLPPTTRELVVEVQASDSWSFSALGETVQRPPPDLASERVSLQSFASQGLPCDKAGQVLPEALQLQAKLQQRARELGQALAAMLPASARQRVAALAGGAAVNGPAILRLRVAGPQANQVLQLPWELLTVESRFPVGAKELHLVREVAREGVQAGEGGMPEILPPLKVVAHMAAPEGARVLPLDLEATAYRIARAMEPIRERVRFTELGTVEDLMDAVRKVTPVLLHFSGHGVPGALVFEDDNGGPQAVQVGPLLTRLRQETPRLPLAVWMSCCYPAGGASPLLSADLEQAAGEESSVAADLHREGIPQVLGYFGPVPDMLAARVDLELFRALAETGHTLEAVQRARQCVQLPLRTEEGWTLFPFAWSLLTLYHRGPERPLTDPRSPLPAEELQSLEREGILLEGVEVLPYGFIGRRRLLALLRRRHRERRRVLGLYGLGGLGKTATMTRLATLLAGGGDWKDRVRVIPVGQAPDPRDASAEQVFRWLWDQVDQVVRGHGGAPPDWAARLEKADRAPDRPQALARALLEAAGDRIVYVDGAERLLQAETEAGAAGVPWCCPDAAAFFQTFCGDTSSKATRLLTSRYQPADTPGWWEEIPPCPTAEVFRMTAWYPVLQRLPVALREELAEQRLAGHPRAVQWVDGLMALEEQRQHQGVSPDDEPGLARSWLVEPALKGLPAKIDQDLALETVLGRLGAAPRALLGECTAIRRPVPLSVVDALGQGSQELRALGLLTRYAAGEDAWKVHPFVSRRAAGAGMRWTRNGRAILGRYWWEWGQQQDAPAAVSESMDHLIAAEAWPEASKVMVALSHMYRFLGWYRARLDMLQGLTSTPWPDKERARWLRELGDAWDDMSDFEEAEKAYRESLDINTRAYGTREHTEVADSLQGLASVLAHQGHYKEAEKALSDSIEIYEHVYGTREKLEVATALHALADVLAHQERYAEAEKDFRDSIGLQHRVHGPHELTNVASSMNGLANVLTYMGRYEEAEQTYRGALLIQMSVHGTLEHAEVAAALHGLAGVLAEQGRNKEAENAYRDSIKIQKRLYGSLKHANVASSLHGLANLLNSQHRYAEAETAFREALDIYKHVYGTLDHISAAAAQHDLAHALAGHERYAEAEKALREAIDILKRVDGTWESADVTLWLHRLATLQSRQKHYAEAEKALRESLSIEEKLFGSRHDARTLSTLSTLAAVLLRQHKADEALTLAREAWDAALEQKLLVPALQAGPPLIEALFLTGQQKEAQQPIQQLLSLLPALPEAHPLRRLTETWFISRFPPPESPAQPPEAGEHPQT